MYDQKPKVENDKISNFEEDRFLDKKNSWIFSLTGSNFDKSTVTGSFRCKGTNIARS